MSYQCEVLRLRMRLRLLIITFLPLMVSCERFTSPLEGVQNETIINLTSYVWINEVKEYLPDSTIYESYETWSFNRTGQGTHKVKFLNVNGQIDERIYYFQWGFTTQNFTVIYMDIQFSGVTFWQINKITPFVLEVIASSVDPVMYPDCEKKYLSFYSDYL